MQSCLILGAGASLANALHFHKERMPEKNPPLDATFFEKISGLKILVPPELRSYAITLLSLDPFSQPRLAPRMEEFFKSLFYDFLQETRADSKISLAYQQLINIYVSVLRQTTDWMAKAAYRGGPVGRLIATVAEKSDQVVIITFNQDLVIENELLKRKLLASRWCIEEGYGSFGNGKEFTTPRVGDAFAAHSDACDHARPITILKPHGSLNWYVRIAGRRPSPHVLKGGAGHREVLITRRRSISDRLAYNLPRRKGRKGRTRWYTWPVIVPPVYSKQSLIESFIPTVWTDTRSAVRDSDRVLFFGYSLPTADIEAQMLFSRALSANTKAGWVDVINPDANAAGRFATLASSKAMRWYSNAEQFLELAPP